MNEFSVMVMAVVFVGTLLFTSRPCYRLILRSIAKREAARLNVSLQDVSFSFDQMVYFIALPTTIPTARDASIDELVIEPYYESYFFPEVNGVQVSIRTGHETIPVAYLPLHDFSLPLLDRYLETRIIDERTNRIIRAHMILHERTAQAIREEVYQQLHEDRAAQ
ncbi:MAG: hypothetical protein LPJ96_11685 [Exiguobacterium sp.]|uniref:Uncharacterized protein n=1 Tax=Exiguobacterium alkaliphilum TaxID=1428684 RepID=A0ABT2KUX9_9BACL|nr:MULTISPECIES: hypothetical protein [Exiguobacterium]MDX5324266.1 hypothetical protein [Exiguobacterium sp.]KDN57878.1 hypothetical protein DI14_05460 [Exiguobacterium sp. AB2]MCT4794348.1 hypothetical protein [Exiguobacterium alkaliphilum]MDX5426101.1 hypothetical protein [Exiguobacterium sp.]MDX6773482.1 hypothetical protein [Exiguobacterium sp.]